MISWLLVYSVIFNPVAVWLAKRSEYLDKLLSCMICTSFWVSLSLLYFVRDLPTHQFVLTPFVSLFFVRVVAHFVGDLHDD
jgi:uncharacterized Tic20 family protein